MHLVQLKRLPEGVRFVCDYPIYGVVKYHKKDWFYYKKRDSNKVYRTSILEPLTTFDMANLIVW